jgi:hypothetical protein
VVRELGESFPLNMIDNISIRYVSGIIDESCFTITHPRLRTKSSGDVHLPVDRVRPQPMGIVVELATQIGSCCDQVESSDRVTQNRILFV